MKTFYLGAFALSLGLFSAPAFADEVKANLDKPVMMTDWEGHQFPVGPGEITIDVQKKGWFFDSRFNVTFKGKHYTILVPRSSYSNDSDVQIDASKSGQGFSVVGKMEAPTLLKTWKSVDQSSCTTPGICMACSPGLDFHGNLTTDCSLKYNLLCPNTQDDLVNNEMYGANYSLEFHDPAHPEKVIARASAAMNPTVDSQTIRNLTACGDHLNKAQEQQQLGEASLGVMSDKMAMMEMPSAMSSTHGQKQEATRYPAAELGSSSAGADAR